MNILSFALVCGLAAVGLCESESNYTVTDEAWFEIEIEDMDGPGQDYTGRFSVALFGETAPMTVMNFVALTKGHKQGKSTLSYKKSPVHRIVQDFVIQMGDITTGDGFGGRSIYGQRFNDEAFTLSHRSPGWVAMANQGPDTNGSQFYVVLSKSRWLDNKHVVFGKIIQGMDTIMTINEVEVDMYSTPKKRVRVIDCGLNKLDKPYEMKEDMLDSTDDM